MKKNQLLLGMGILIVSLFPGVFASANCQEIRFSNEEKFCFDIQKISSERFKATTNNVSPGILSDLRCKLTLPNGEWVALPKCEGEFGYGGRNGSVEIRADIQNHWYELIAYYDFKNGTFGYQHEYPVTFTPERVAVSDSSPDKNEWVDMTLRVRSSSSNYYHDGVDFYVEEYRSGRRNPASSYDYQLDRSRYQFLPSDQGEVRLRNFVKFTSKGEFRVIAQLHNFANKNTFHEFEVEDDFSPSYAINSLDIRSISPSSPRVDQWIDLTVRALDRYGDRIKDYDGDMRLEIEEYRNGSWRSASNSDYELEDRRLRFSHYDNGEKTFSDVIKFRTKGNFRIKILDDDHRWIYGTKEVSVRTSSSYDDYYSNVAFTDKELRKIRAVADLWKGVVFALENDYPRLRKSTYRKRISDDFYTNMQGVLRNNSTSFRNRSDFYTAFLDWLSITVKTR